MPDTTPPRWIALSWQLRESTPVTDGLSIARIVQAGIEIADEHGLGGLSLRKLGEHLGAGTMAAYRHMRSKEELIHLMVDVAFGQPPEGIIEATDWRTGVRLWAGGMAERYRQHSWLLDAPLVAMSITPNRLLWLEHILRPLGETGLDIQHLLDAALFVDGHVRHVAYLRRELRARTSSSPQVMPPWLSALLDDDSFPMARRVSRPVCWRTGMSRTWSTVSTGSSQESKQTAPGLAKMAATGKVAATGQPRRVLASCKQALFVETGWPGS